MDLSDESGLARWRSLDASRFTRSFRRRSPWRRQSGEADKIFCIDIIISQCKREVQALFSSGANFQAMFEKSSDAIDGRWLKVRQ
jgi:hypothetical protein